MKKSYKRERLLTLEERLLRVEEALKLSIETKMENVQEEDPCNRCRVMYVPDCPCGHKKEWDGIKENSIVRLVK